MNSPYIRMHIIVFMWGFTGVVGKLITLPPLPLVVYRMSFAFLVIGAYLLIRRTNIKIGKKNIINFLLIGMLLGTHWICFFSSIKLSNVSIGLSILSTGPFFVSIIEPILFKRKIQKYQILLSLIVFLCIMWMFNTEMKYLWGIILGLLASFTSALLSVVNAKIHDKADNSVIMFYQLLGGSFFVFIFSLLFMETPYSQVKINDIYWLIILGGILTAYPMIEAVRLMKHISPFTLVLSISLEPIYGIILAYFIFKDGSEVMDINFYIATAIILLVVLLNGVIAKRKRIVK